MSPLWLSFPCRDPSAARPRAAPSVRGSQTSHLLLCEVLWPSITRHRPEWGSEQPKATEPGALHPGGRA